MKVDLGKLRELCKNNENYNEINKAIDSLHDRQEYARYHLKEYQKLSNIKDNVDAVKLAIFLDNESYERRLAIDANFIACIQNMHIVHDVLGYLIFIVFKLNMVKDYVTLFNVINNLTNLKDNKYLTLLDLLDKLTLKGENSPSPFQSLNDIVNHSKHKYTIKPKFTTNFSNGESIRTSHFDKFTQQERNHEKMNADYFIQTEYIRESKLIIEIENELILILEDKIEKEQSN